MREATRSILHALTLVVGVLVVACGPALKIPESALIACHSNADCTTGYVCITTTGLCAVAATVDHVPPGLSGTVTPSPALARDGTEIQVEFTSTKPLSIDPVVTAALGGGASGSDGGSSTATFVKVSKSENTYVYKWIAHSGDPEGTVTVTIDMVDRIGNPGTGSGGSFVLDFTPPAVIADSTTLSLKSAKAGDTQTISFVATEAVSNVTVKVGQEMAIQSTSSGNQYSYTYVIPSNAQEGSTDVTVHFEDAVGNDADVTLGSFIIDRTAPAVATGTDLLTGPLRAGDDIRVRLDFTEPVGDGTAALGVTLTSGSTTTEMLRANGSSGISSHWEFLHTVRPGEDGSWTATVHDGTDAAGNTMSTHTLTGSVSVDTTAPTINAPVVPANPLKNADTLSVSFTVSETLSADPVVTIRGKALTRASGSNPPAYVYTRTVDKTLEGEGGAPVIVELADAAGNRGSGSLGTVVYDFTPPDIVSGSPALTLAPPSGSLVNTVSAITTGTRAVVTFTATEVLKAAPVVTATSGNTTLTFTVTGHPSTSYVATLDALPGSLAQGHYDVKAQLVDQAGNTVQPTLTLAPIDFKVDTAPPSALSTAAQGLVTYIRNPWGSKSSAGRPQFQLVGQAGAVEAGNTIIAYDSGDVNHRTELGRKVAPSDQTGAFTMDLQQSDNEVVYLTSVDPAGNASSSVDVKNVKWTATLNSKVVGDTIANPHALYTASSLALPRPGIDALVEANDEAKSGTQDGNSALATAGWTEVFSNGAAAYRAPNARRSSAMVYDASRGRTVLFGGTNTNGDVLGDTWEWDGRGWQHMLPVHSPPARLSHAMVYDSKNKRIVLFGGQDLFAPEPGSEHIFSDTWVWNGADWKQLATAHSPGQRVQHAMAYDSAHDRVVLFGGTQDPKYLQDHCVGSSSTACGDTWSFDGSDWAELTPAHSPPAAYGGAMAYDVGRGVSVFFGGTSPDDFSMKVYEWDGLDWASIDCLQVPPVGHTLTYNPDTGRTLLYGGNTLGQYYTVVWEWDGVAFTNLFPSVEPIARRFHSAAYDSARKEFVIFSGSDGGQNAILTEKMLSDTWEYDGSTWAQRAPSNPPIALQVHSMTFDSARGRVVTLGDYESPGQWEFDGTNWAKTVASIDPGMRYWPGLAFDPVNNWLMLFGGLEVGTGFFAGTSEPQNDTWTFGNGNWHLTGLSGPPAGYPATAVAYDEARGQHVLLIAPPSEEGGEMQTWIGGVTGWEEATPAHVPVIGACRSIDSRGCGAGKVAYDPFRHVVVYVFDDGSTRLLTWEWNGEDWTDKTPANSPPIRQWPGLAWDAARGRIQLWGGIDEQDHDLSDTWEWNGTSWTERPQAVAPPGRYASEMVSDTWRSRVTLYGGNSHSAGSCGTVGLGVCSDTWALNTPEERGALVAEFDARRAARPTSLDPAARTVTGISLTTIAAGNASSGVRSVQVVRPGGPESIPDSTKPAGVTQKLYQSRACHIVSTEVTLRITHDIPEGLTATLTSPSGASVKLFQENATQENQKTRFPNLTQPVDPLTAFEGTEGSGYWTLQVTNSQTDTLGTLDGWGLGLKCTEPTAQPGVSVYAWDPAGSPWDLLSSSTTSFATQASAFDRTWASPEGTSIDGWNNGGFYRFAVAPTSAAGAGAGSAQLDYVELTLSYRRE